MKMILTLLLAICTQTLQAAWYPDNHFENALEQTTSPDFISLKQQLSTYLKDSWMTQEKLDLIMDLTLITRPQVCVEIGAFTGSSLLPIAATLQNNGSGIVYAVDAWSAQETVKNMSFTDPNRSWWESLDMDHILQQFQAALEAWSLKDQCIIITKPSLLAAAAVPDTIDFLHIDGDYTEIGSLQDVITYLPKVKKGGYILLSNALLTINNNQPKKKAFCLLYEACSIVCDVDNGNGVLFVKNL